MEKRAPSTWNLLLSLCGWTLGLPILLSLTGYNHSLAYIFAAVAGYSVHAAWRSFQRENVLRYAWINMSDEYIEHLRQFEDYDLPILLDTERWVRLVDKQKRLMRRWHIRDITVDDKYQWFT